MLVAIACVHNFVDKINLIMIIIMIGNENNLFYINPYNGSLYANQSLDREEMSSYTIGVMVCT